MINFDAFPLFLSLQVASLATLLNLVLGIAVGWCLSRLRFPGRDLLRTLIAAPLVLPPTVLGYYLLVIFGRGSFIGQFLDAAGIPLVFTWRGAVLAAAVASFPLTAMASLSAIEGVDRQLEWAARTLGRSEIEVFWTVTLPLAWRGILAGVMLAFARALGDFGTTLMVAGSIPGRTQTLPLAVYDAVQANDLDRAGILVALLTVVAMALLLLVQKFGQRMTV